MTGSWLMGTVTGGVVGDELAQFRQAQLFEPVNACDDVLIGHPGKWTDGNTVLTSGVEEKVHALEFERYGFVVGMHGVFESGIQNSEVRIQKGWRYDHGRTLAGGDGQIASGRDVGKT